jgi:predicted amidohydrolase
MIKKQFMNIGIVAMESDGWELENNFNRMEAYVRQAVSRRAELVITPEAVLDGYAYHCDPDVTKERLMEIAQQVPDGPYLLRSGRLSKELGIYLILGFLEKAGDELFNSCAMFDPQGKLIAKYSKVHPATEAFITPGRELKPFDTPIGRIGFLICGDRNVPHNFATLAAQGVEIVFLPMDGGGNHPNTQLMQTRAWENYCWIVQANTWSSVIVTPHGSLYHERYEKECVSVQRLDLGENPPRNNFKFRRPDLYGPLTAEYEKNGWYTPDGGISEQLKQERVRHLENLRKAQDKPSLF